MIHTSEHAFRTRNMENVDILLPEKWDLYAIQQTNDSHFPYMVTYSTNICIRHKKWVVFLHYEK